MNIKVKLDENAIVPKKAHEADAGYDLMTPDTVYIMPHSEEIIDTGVHMLIPQGHVGLVVNKSGLNMKKQITTKLGVIDSGYTGSVRVKLVNDSDNGHEFKPGDKISQIVFLPVDSVDFVEVQYMPETPRGENGFGSTGA